MVDEWAKEYILRQKIQNLLDTVRLALLQNESSLVQNFTFLYLNMFFSRTGWTTWHNVSRRSGSWERVRHHF